MRLHLDSIVASAAISLFGAIRAGYATDIDPNSAIRGSLGVSLEDLSLGNTVGTMSFYLNAGFALVICAVAIFAIVRRRRRPTVKVGSPIKRSALRSW
jgi:hypothetical protein